MILYVVTLGVAYEGETLLGAWFDLVEATRFANAHEASINAEIFLYACDPKPRQIGCRYDERPLQVNP